MKKIELHNLFRLAGFIFSILLFSSSQAQNIYTVDDNPGTNPDFTSLQSAMSAAMNGDTIYVMPSENSYGNIIIDKELHIRGMGHHPPGSGFVSSRVGTATFQNGCEDSSVSGMRFNHIGAATNSDSDNVRISNCRMNYMRVAGDSWIIEGCVITSEQANVGCIDVDDYANVLFHHNIISFDATPGLGVLGAITEANSTTLEYNNIYILTGNMLVWSCNNLEFRNSIFLSTREQDGFYNQSSSQISYENCLTYNYYGYNLEVSGDNNLNNTDPMFENLNNDLPQFSYSNNYNPASGSPLINAGSDGDNIGIYNDNYAFDQDGHAFDLPYITNMEILTPTLEIGEDVNVEFSATGQ